MGPGARGHGMRGCGVACCNSLLGSSVGLGRRAWAMGHGLNMGMDSWGVVWECGNLVVDGGGRERRGVEIISWVVRLGGALCDWLLGAWRRR